MGLRLDLIIREIEEFEIPLKALKCVHGAFLGGSHGAYNGKYKKNEGEKTPRFNQALILINKEHDIVILAKMKDYTRGIDKRGEVRYQVFDVMKSTMDTNCVIDRIIKKYNIYFKKR